MALTGVQAIETRYAGCRFRSRTEARWAVAFDKMGLSWQYEPQGYVIEDLKGQRSLYLPDFLLPDLGTWVEVKGSGEALDRDRLEAAAISLPIEPAKDRGPQLLLLGSIPRSTGYGWAWFGLYPRRDRVHDIGLFAAEGRWAFERDYPHCRLRHMESEVKEFRWGLKGDLTKPDEVSLVSDHGAWHPSDAYTAARSARFEHGETP